MSYIRSTSNREKLYIFDDHGTLTIDGDNVKLTMPHKTFRKLMKLATYDKMFHQELFEVDGAKLELDQDTFLWHLYYQFHSQRITMCEATLWYIVSRNNWK